MIMQSLLSLEVSTKPNQYDMYVISYNKPKVPLATNDDCIQFVVCKNVSNYKKMTQLS
jgi:hypothetical protein